MTDLTALFRDVVAENPGVTPEDAATAVKARLSRQDYPAALDQALPALAREVLASVAAEPVLPVAAEPVPPISQSRRRAGKPSAASPKVAALRKYGAVYRQWLHVGDGLRRMLGDCSADEILYAIKTRERIAADNLAVAGRLREVHTLMLQRGARHVRDLPESEVAAVLRRVA